MYMRLPEINEVISPENDTTYSSRLYNILRRTLSDVPSRITSQELNNECREIPNERSTDLFPGSFIKISIYLSEEYVIQILIVFQLKSSSQFLFHLKWNTKITLLQP